MKWYSGDWLKDPQLSACSPATRGVWADLISAMHESDQSGQLIGTPEQLARLGRCSPVELVQALTDLRTTRAADVTCRNDVYTVVNRRMSREFKKRQNAANRQRKHRSKSPSRSDDDDVTGEKREGRSQNSNKNPSTPSAKSRARGSGVFVDITKDVLEHRSLLKHWFAQESKRKDRWVSSESDWVNVQAASAKALSAEDVADPVALFKWLVKGHHWDHLSDANDDLAKAFKLDIAALADKFKPTE